MEQRAHLAERGQLALAFDAPRQMRVERRSLVRGEFTVKVGGEPLSLIFPIWMYHARIASHWLTCLLAPDITTLTTREKFRLLRERLAQTRTRAGQARLDCSQRNVGDTRDFLVG